MFHKALWMWNWKRGKYAVLLFFFSSLYLLSFEYYQAAEVQQSLFLHPERLGEEKFYYHYSFYSSNSFGLGIITIILACILIGWERSNQNGNSLLTFPFKRRDIFLSKWVFGGFFIVLSLLINWSLMYFIYKSTIHFDYQSFEPFHRYFLYAILTYIAIYTVSLCIGTFTGSILSQGIFSITFCIMGMGIFSLLLVFFTTHAEAIQGNKSYTTFENIYKFNKKTNISSAILDFSISYNYHPTAQSYEDHGKTIQRGPTFHSYYSAKVILVPIFYTICSLLIGMFLYTRSPNEHNKKIFLFQKYNSLWIWSTIFYFALIGGQMLKRFDLLFSYYVGVFLFGIVTYFILSRLTNYKVF
ncbi:MULTISPECIES: ABC transporter permease [Bacillus]|uniref:ABC transporter permease n=1 Tax=Bacillus TaxID=1386 RepID=UPI0002E409AE|nr:MULTISPECIES: ABC transporter permease [Bacillus]MCU5437469.1 ABC transporter permease [Bacillus cereus]MCU5443349.1 ABC transporter permease [Bacillus cereus]MCU5482649.1 ABC transporter permease [Bacillus cereus]MEC4696616.1 ABC transporter permease [Bacillus anthracis]OKA26832.1 acetoin ABC transporter permease [Bacillus cereus]